MCLHILFCVSLTCVYQVSVHMSIHVYVRCIYTCLSGVYPCVSQYTCISMLTCQPPARLYTHVNPNIHMSTTCPPPIYTCIYLYLCIFLVYTRLGRVTKWSTTPTLHSQAAGPARGGAGRPMTVKIQVSDSQRPRRRSPSPVKDSDRNSDGPRLALTHVIRAGWLTAAGGLRLGLDP